MAYEFPRYLSKAKATTDQPSHFAPESTEGQQLEQMAKVGQTAQNATFKMGEAYQEARKTTAELNQRTQNDDLLARATADPDVNAYEKYRQENEKIKKDSVAGFKNNSNAGDAIAKADYYAKTTDTQLQAVFRKKMIDNQQANLLSLSDIDAKQGNFESIKARIEKNKQMGFIGAEDAYKLEEKYSKQVKQNAFLSDLSVSADLASENLQGYGFDVSETAKAKKMIDSAKKKEKEEFKNVQMATVNDFGEKLASRSLTMEEVEGAISSGLIDAEMGASFELAMAAPDRWTEFAEGKDSSIRADNFIKPLETLSKSENVDQRMKIIKSALRNRVDGKLDAEDLNFILRVGAGKSKDPQGKIWGFLNSAINSIPAPTKSGGEIAKKFMANWDMQEDPRPVMHQAAIDQFKEDHPETAPYKLGDKIKRKSGSYIVDGFNEDGSPTFKRA